MHDISRSRDNVCLWMAAAFCAELILACVVIAHYGAGGRGTGTALQVTARFSFLLFWLAYSVSALAALFDAPFDVLKRRARHFGLAFAAAHLVHLGLVAWLYYLGEGPPRGSLVFFGVAVFWTYLLVLFSIDRSHRPVARIAWRVVSLVGLNYIMLAFATDFLRVPFSRDAEYLLGYLPFIVLSIIAPVLRLAAWARGIYQAWRNATYPAK
jgi:hypothetical protein